MSIDFNGSSHEGSTPITATLRPSVPVTAGAWIRPDTLKTAGIVTNNKTTTQHRGFWLNLSGTSGDIEASYGDNTGSGTPDRRSKVATAGVTTGAWQYVGASFRGATDMSIYLNGSDVGGTYSGSGGALQYNTSFGGRIGSLAGANFFDGRIAEVAIWIVSLSAAEHLALARGVSALRIRPESLVGYWPMYDSVSAAADLSPQSLELATTAGTSANHSPTNCPFPA